MDELLREWLGITRADIYIYASTLLAIMSMFFYNVFLVLILFIASIVLGLYSCKIGTPAKKELGRLTNLYKNFAYPFILIVLILFMLLKSFFLFG